MAWPWTLQHPGDMADLYRNVMTNYSAGGNQCVLS